MGPRTQLDTVGKRAVRILLECFLVAFTVIVYLQRTEKLDLFNWVLTARDPPAPLRHGQTCSICSPYCRLAGGCNSTEIPSCCGCGALFLMTVSDTPLIMTICFSFTLKSKAECLVGIRCVNCLTIS